MSIKRLPPEAVETFSILLHPKRTYSTRRRIATPAPGPPAAPVPVVLSVSYPYVDVLGGGQRVVVTVDASADCSAISAGGVDFTSFLVDDATHVSGIPGAHAAGVVDVVVTNGAGDSNTGTGLIEYFDPTSIVDLYLDSTDYSVGTWTARKGANATEVPIPPAVGPSLGGRATTSFDGSNALVVSTASDYVTLGEWWALCLFNVTSIATNDPVNHYKNDTIWCDSNTLHTDGNYLGFTLRDVPKLQVANYPATSVFDEADISTGTWTAGLGKYDGVNLYSRVGSGAWSAGTASANATTLMNDIQIGANYNRGHFFTGDMAVLALAKVVPSDADITKLLGVIEQQWGVTT